MTPYYDFSLQKKDGFFFIRDQCVSVYYFSYPPSIQGAVVVREKKNIICDVFLFVRTKGNIRLSPYSDELVDVLDKKGVNC